MRSDSSRRQPTPRPRKVPSDRSTALLVVILMLVLTAFLAQAWWCLRPTEDHADVGTITHDSLAPTYTCNGEIIRWYVFTDPDTGKQYLVNDRGGGMPRIGTDGEQMRTNSYDYD